MADADIHITETDPGEFVVEVREGDDSTRHEVRVPAGVGVPGATDEEVVRTSFEFLLEREPKEQILSAFDLPMISRYFPEYQQELERRLA